MQEVTMQDDEPRSIEQTNLSSQPPASPEQPTILDVQPVAPSPVPLSTEAEAAPPLPHAAQITDATPSLETAPTAEVQQPPTEETSAPTMVPTVKVLEPAAPAPQEAAAVKEESKPAVAKQPPVFETRPFATLEEAEAAIEAPAPEPVMEEPTAADVEAEVAEAPAKRRSRTSGRATSRQSTKRARSTTAAAPPAHEDDTEVSDGPSQGRQHPRKRARVSEGASRVAVSALPQSELSLDDLPEGWTKPLFFFATMTEKQHWKQWKALPERRVCNGAVWLSPNCTGTPGVTDHVDGPTTVLRDLVALLQNPSDPIKLHENNYTSLARANARSAVTLSKVSEEFGVTRVLKALTEKEYIQRIPLDLICGMLVQQLRHMLKLSKRFPSHLFAPELHLYQNAPTVAFHLLGSGVPVSLADCLAAFGDENSQSSINILREEYRRNVGARTAGSRRRGEGSTSAAASFFMTNEIIKHLNSVLTAVQARLDSIRARKFGPKSGVSSQPVIGKAYTKGDLIVKDLPVRLVPRSTAALRDRVYDFYDISSFIIQSDASKVEQESAASYTQAVALHAKEDTHWLDSVSMQYLDLTLSEAEEAWLVSRSRWSEDTPPPLESDAQRIQLHSLVSHTSSVASNAEIIISLKVAHGEERADKVQARNKVFVTVRATQDIKEDEPVVLEAIWKKSNWAEIADDKEAM